MSRASDIKGLYDSVKTDHCADGSAPLTVRNVMK